MRDLKIVFTKSKKTLPIGSWLIRLWTWKEYSHVAVCFDTTKYFGTKTYYQASDGLVNYMSEEQFLKKHEIVKSYTMSVPESVYKLIRSECHKEAGANYGFLQNVGIALADILSLVGISISNPWKRGRNCSELLYVKIPALSEAVSYRPDLIKPHHIENILKILKIDED